MTILRPSHTHSVLRAQRLRLKPALLQIGALICGSLLTLVSLAQAAPYPANIDVAPASFWSCVYRDINPPHGEYVRYIEAPSKEIAEARMKAQLPPHQVLVGCGPTQQR